MPTSRKSISSLDLHAWNTYVNLFQFTKNLPPLIFLDKTKTLLTFRIEFLLDYHEPNYVRYIFFMAF